MVYRTSVMISSTAIDLPQHREVATQAIFRMSMYPIVMEHLSAMSPNALEVSLNMVDNCDYYLGIIGQRYGFVPENYSNPNRISITEMEYRRAIDKNKPCLIFLMGDDHPITPKDIELDPEKAAKLLSFKEELKTSHIVSWFNSVDELREQIITAISQNRSAALSGNIHTVTDIPVAPAPFIAHPYTLLQTAHLIGRTNELNLLSKWFNDYSANARIFTIVGMGGMGKSALLWNWFNQIALNESYHLAGQVWWSFYESDGHFENFILRMLAYVSGISRDQIEKINLTERENILLKALNERSYLIVMDGFERLLSAYTGTDSLHLDDLDFEAPIGIDVVLQKPDFLAASIKTARSLRDTINPHVGDFLRKLAGLKNSHIVISTRLLPLVLQTDTGIPIPGCTELRLGGLADEDAIRLWEEMGVRGGRDILIKLFHSFENYPLLIRLLAGEVAHFRQSPGDLDAWLNSNREFDPFTRPLVLVRKHVLHYSFQSITGKTRDLLSLIAAVHSSVSYQTLCELSVSSEKKFQSELVLFHSELDLDASLRELEDRELIGWDRESNRYQMHPVIRGTIRNITEKSQWHNILVHLNWYFQSLPEVKKEDIYSIDDIYTTVQHYYVLIELGNYDEACDMFWRLINEVSLYRFSWLQLRQEMLESLFTSGIDNLPSLKNPDLIGFALGALATTYKNMGYLKFANDLFSRQIDVVRQNRRANQKALGIAWNNISDILRQSGKLHLSLESAMNSILVLENQKYKDAKAVSIIWLGTVFSTIGDTVRARNCLETASLSLNPSRNANWIALANIRLSQLFLWQSQYERAENHLSIAREWLSKYPSVRDDIRILRQTGMIELALGRYTEAENNLTESLLKARNSLLAEEEISSLIGLSRIYCEQLHFDYATELLLTVNSMCSHRSFRLLKADVQNLLCDINIKIGNLTVAVEWALKAYRTAWCDGQSTDNKVSFTYLWGILDAKHNLELLNIVPPSLAPFDKEISSLSNIDWDKILQMIED